VLLAFYEYFDKSRHQENRKWAFLSCMVLQIITKEGNAQEIPLREESVVCFVCKYSLAELG